MSKLIDEMPQLSKLPPSISSVSIKASPLLFNSIVTFCVITTGATLSSIVTIVVPVALLPFTSVTVNVTVFAPTLLQLNVSTSKA